MGDRTLGGEGIRGDPLQDIADGLAQVFFGGLEGGCHCRLQVEYAVVGVYGSV